MMSAVTHSMKVKEIISIIVLQTEMQCLQTLIQQLNNYKMIHMMSNIHTEAIFSPGKGLRCMCTDENVEYLSFTTIF